MSNLFYLKDAYLKSFDTKVTDIIRKGNQIAVILKDTIFYPEGGGQPSDHGTIKGNSGELTVTQVTYNNGDPLNFGTLTGQLEVGDSVTCALDWDRRYRHMQLHSAGHILHEAIQELLPELKPVEGKHGRDLYLKYQGIIDASLSKKITVKANQIIQANLPISIRFVSLDELKRISPHIPENLPNNKPLRIIQIGDHPPTPDGGTQVAKTGEVPLINVVSIDYDDGGNTVVKYSVDSPSVHSSDPNPTSQVKHTTPISNIFANILALFQSDISINHNKEEIKVKYLGRNGLLNQTLRQELNMSDADKSQIGQSFNQTKSQIESLLGKTSTSTTNKFDPTLPGSFVPLGHLHPTTIVIREMNDILKKIGFVIVDGPELETEEYNFRRLNLPIDHPARDLQDTIYVKEPNYLLRTHTSSVEAHVLEDFTPPYRVAIPGKCFRYESVNASNHYVFNQYQAVVVGEGITMANLFWTIEYFFKGLYGQDVKFRFRQKYYPEVEPGVGPDMLCSFCHGSGCAVCKKRGWIEMGGAGMIHPNMLRLVGLDPAKYSGFAWGMGLDRFVMTRFGIKDIRSLYNGDISFT